MPQSYQDFHRRQIRAEKRWERVFFRYLKSEYLRAGKNYPEPYIPDTESLEKIFRRLYSNLVLDSAKYVYKEEMQHIEGRRKDFLDDFVEILSSTSDTQSGLFSIWNSLIGEFLVTRMNQRISHIVNTTIKTISQIEEIAIEQGEIAVDIGRRIIAEGENRKTLHRSRAIGRTETTYAINQGKYIAALSSRYEMEKSWVSMRDNRVRITHNHIDINKFGDWIPLKQDFWLQDMRTGTLKPASYPCDNRLDAGNVINCRCQIQTRYKRDESGRLIRKT